MIYRYGEVDLVEKITSIPILKRRRGNPKNRRKQFNYKDIVAAFDIETSLIKTGSHNANSIKNPHIIDDFSSVMYIWQFQLGADLTIIGREWWEFMSLIHDLETALEDDERLLIFVHNLSYEWQFLRDMQLLGPKVNEESVFCVKSRTLVRFLCCNDRVEFRCAYLLTNLSLDDFTDHMEVEHRKLDGDEFDYSKIRYSWTSLTDREMEYCVNDVIGLVEAINKKMMIDGDTLYSLPLTSTGYVRRDIKKAIRKIGPDYITKQLPDYPTYRMLREAFRGGNTHASRHFSNKRIDTDVTCMDISSSYPNVLVNQRYPVTAFREIDRDSLTIDHIIKLIRKGRAVLARIAMWDVKLRDLDWPVPYLSREKCRNILGAYYDNGRILEAQYLETTVTDVDLQIILEEYSDDTHIEILDAMFASYGYLPEPIRDVIRGYYVKKTELKDVPGQEIYYVNAKALLNSIFGMAAQNPVRLEDAYMNHDYVIGIHYKEGEERKWLSDEEALVQGVDILEIAHRENIEKSTMPYQWGVWCTSWARKSLEDMIRIAGPERFLYCDTDSCYLFGGDESEFSDYNRDRMEDSLKNGAYATDIYGEVHFMGVLEVDKKIRSFKTMGAKKYAYIDKKGLHITIAGVNKEKGAAELQRAADELNRTRAADDQLDGLDMFSEYYIFTDAGGTESVYNDDPIDALELDGHSVYVPTNVAIKPSTYKIGLGGDYKQLLEFLLDNNLFRLYRENYEGYWIDAIEA